MQKSPSKAYNRLKISHSIEINYYHIITETIKNINAYLNARLFITIAIILENISQ